jgi:hypothetical protein
MSKTKFTKVAVSDNPPEEGSLQIFLTEGGLRKVILYRAKWFQGLYKYYLVESPDREDEMRDMLEECKKSLVWVYENCIAPGANSNDEIYNICYRLQELENLLQSLKQ